MVAAHSNRSSGCIQYDLQTGHVSYGATSRGLLDAFYMGDKEVCCGPALFSLSCRPLPALPLTCGPSCWRRLSEQVLLLMVMSAAAACMVVQMLMTPEAAFCYGADSCR